MIRRIVFILVLLISLTVNGQIVKKDSFYVANWNLENLYDTEDDTLKNDEEFLPGSDKRWNNERYDHKINNITRVLNYMNHGCGPDIIAMEEVENINVVKKLIYNMRDHDYIVAHRDSPDRRGIDVALMYDRNVFKIDSLAALHVELPNGNPTRDILHVVLIHKKDKEKFHIYVNHWPSRTGGVEKSNINRLAAASVLKKSLDTLAQTSPKSKVIILGDFNDEPNNESVEKILGAEDFDCKKQSKNAFLNLAYKKFSNEEGSYLYKGKFDMIDQIIISSTLIDGKKFKYDCNSFEIIKPPFIVFEEGNRKGGAIPTYEGNKYIGGYSDHFPIGAKFIYRKNK
ncbi:MAG: hypothetical protein NTX65_00795 [Ignavibacteriales bacterium]|nr:hypothetical protein [Ignavibacteriales bacterium]